MIEDLAGHLSPRRVFFGIARDGRKFERIDFGIALQLAVLPGIERIAKIVSDPGANLAEEFGLPVKTAILYEGDDQSRRAELEKDRQVAAFCFAAEEVKPVIFSPALRSVAKADGLRAWVGLSDGSRLLAVQALLGDERSPDSRFSATARWSRRVRRKCNC